MRSKFYCSRKFIFLFFYSTFLESRMQSQKVRHNWRMMAIEFGDTTEHTKFQISFFSWQIFKEMPHLSSSNTVFKSEVISNGNANAIEITHIKENNNRAKLCWRFRFVGNMITTQLKNILILNSANILYFSKKSNHISIHVRLIPMRQMQLISQNNF